MAATLSLEGLSVSDLSKMATRTKTSFTRAHNELLVRLDNLQQCYTSPSFQDDARQSLEKVRERYDRVIDIYEEIKAKVAEEVWESTYADKMKDVEDKKTTSENKQALVFTAAVREQQQQEILMNASISVPGGAAAAAATGGGQKWKIEASFQPKQLVSSEMTLQELNVWLGSWESYCEISRMQLAPFGVQRAAFMQCLNLEIKTKIDFSHAHNLESCIQILIADFKKRNPRLVLRHRWIKISQRKGEKWSDFSARERMLRKNIDIHEMTADQWVAHILVAGCSNGELLKKFLEVGEDDLTESKIAQVAEQFEISASTAEGLHKGEKEKERVNQVKAGNKDLEKVSCFSCRERGHYSKDCRVPKKKLKCSWCGTTGIHNTNDWCKAKMEEKATEAEKAKVDQVKAGGAPVGHGKENEADANQVKASEMQSDNSDVSDDDDMQQHFARQCKTEEMEEEDEEEYICSSSDSMLPTPTVEIKMRNGPCLRQAKICEACPDTGATANILAERAARRMGIRWRPSRVTLKNASGASMKVIGEAKVYAALKHGKTKMIRVIVSPDLEDEMLLGWRSQKTLGMLPSSWPEVMLSERCNQVTAEEEGKKKEKQADFPIDPKYSKVLALVREYEDVFHDHLDETDRLCEGELDLKLKPGVEPYLTNRVQRVNFHEMPGCMRALNEHINGGLMVEHDDKIHGEIKWLFYGQYVDKGKGDGSFRIVGDFKELNDRIVKDVYHFPTPEDLWRGVKPESNLFFVCDATSSYNQIRNSESTMKMMAVALPTTEGTKYMHFTTAGMGCSNSGPAWCRASDKVVRGVDCMKGVDDCLVQATSEEEMLPKLRDLLEAARKGNMKFSRKKIQIGGEVDFCGFRLTNKGLQPSPKKVSSIMQYPDPLDESSMRSFLGMVNQFSKFFPDLSHLCKPLREKLKKDVIYEFGPVEQLHFKKIKEAMSTRMNLVAYSPDRFTRLYHDACDTGLAYMLVQRHDEEECWCQLEGPKCFCKYRILWCNSRALKPSFKGLPALYLEAMGHHWAITDAQFYLKGTRQPFECVTDHFPLVAMTRKPMDELPPRLKELFMELRSYNYFTSHIAGSRNIIADTLSRTVHWSPKEEENQEESWSKVEAGFARQVIGNKHNFLWKDPLMKEIIKQVQLDKEYMEVLQLVKDRRDKAYIKGKVKSDHPARAYLKVWERLGYEEDKETEACLMTLDTSRICVPRGVDEMGVSDGHLRRKIARRLHIPHLGEIKTGRAAERRYYWPAMWQQVVRECKDCDTCVRNQQSQASEPPPEEEDLASYPMEKMSADLCHFEGDTWLVLVDWYSNFTFAKNLGKTGGTDKVIKKLRKIFFTFGFAKCLKTDAGPEFRGRFQEWAEEAGITTSYSSAYNSPGNSRAEKAVQETKKLLRRVKDNKEDWLLAFSEWRNAPTVEGPSPAQLFYSRQVRSCVLPELFQEPNIEEMMVERRQQEREKRAERMTRQPSKGFARDEKVWMQSRDSLKWDIPGWIRGARPHGRSFIVETDSGGLYLRNRRFIKSRVEREEAEGEGGKILNEGGTGGLSQEKREVTAGKEGGKQPAGRQTYAAVTRAASRPTVPTVTQGVTTRSRARRNGGLGGSEVVGL